METKDLIISDKCAHCENGQKRAYGERLCDYGVQAVPVLSMRHPNGICGPDARLFAKKQKYAEFDDV
jgi:hypothetical protein